jgi:hypothetical protein
VYAGLDEHDQALAWLSKAVGQRDVALFLQSDPVYDRLRSDPRFQALLRQVNFNGSTSLSRVIHPLSLSSGLSGG